MAALTAGLPLGPEVRTGAGDDCAVIGGKREAIWQLLKTDVVIEGVHFEPGEKMRRVGWKALCRNLSDIAAMGGWPCHALITLAISPEREWREARDLYAGLTRAARRFGVSIVGGETARSPGPLFVSVALTGRVERSRCVWRSGGRPGDLLYVTGRLGGSRAKKHLDFTPRLEPARWLATHCRPRAMMDLSDGLGADLPRLARASGCGFVLREECIPRTRGCSLEQALGDGEDFELLLAVEPGDGAKLEAGWARVFPKLPLTAIGELSKRGPAAEGLCAHGFDHFQ